MFVPFSSLHAERSIFKVKKEAVNVRAKPSLKSQVIGQLSEGDYIFTEKEKIVNGWVPVKIGNGAKGYVKTLTLEDVTPHGLKETLSFYFNYFMEKYFLTTFFLLIVLGIILGFTKVVVVFRDYRDVTVNASLILFPFIALLAGGHILIYFNSNLLYKAYFVIVALVELGMLIWIIINTYRDNGSIVKTLLALITKIPLTTLFALAVLEVFSPGEKGKKRDKTDAIAILLLILPLIYGLVRHRVWKYSGEVEEEMKELSPEELVKTIKPKV